MKLNLFFLLCLTGLISVTVPILRTVPHRYDLMMTTQTWYNARNYCRVVYDDLATILSDTDWLRLKKEITSKGLQTSTWTGVYKNIYTWRWTLNDIPLWNSTYINWYPGQPNNYYTQETCGIIAAAYQWHDVPCNLVRPFICYDVRFGDANKFIRINNPLLTWPQARTHCQTYYTDLASALNSSDYALLVQLMMIQGDSWIGLYRDMDNWEWSDGTRGSNLPWYPGQPDNYWGSENCAVLYNGFFYDEHCANQHYYFCHTISPKRSQTVRLQVKSDGSVFDPAVQSSILEQIKQKLKENGMMENTIVTWWVQPDGNIFQKQKKG
ncbi:macrophage mannose receptor 1-like [Hemibagrus wyckioides]|uniref:macrophage mannose receptor 1-like n=1 Tax=Hemibagrus wyckioides TaxID=337641 RepID=UPI00266B59E6|nr:macrophage mannose receptor 1-like [Hemibagrus wyckioides]